MLAVGGWQQNLECQGTLGPGNAQPRCRIWIFQLCQTRQGGQSQSKLDATFLGKQNKWDKGSGCESGSVSLHCHGDTHSNTKLPPLRTEDRSWSALKKDLRDSSEGSEGCFDVLSCDLGAEVSDKDVEMVLGGRRERKIQRVK